MTGATGTRIVTSNDGTYTIAGTTSIRLTSTQTSYVYVNSSLYAGAATDASGLALSLTYVQQDPTGCTGNTIVIAGRTVICPNLQTTSVQNSIAVVAGLHRAALHAHHVPHPVVPVRHRRVRLLFASQLRAI